MRIIGGSARGRKLKAPTGSSTRPTSDRVREALFSILGQPPTGASILDLFAGSGGLGFEALSRGARNAVFVDLSSVAVQMIRANAAGLGMQEQATVIRGEALRMLKRLSQKNHCFHWIFVDPPYASPLAHHSLTALGKHTAHSAPQNRVLHPDGFVIVEHNLSSPSAETYDLLVRTDVRRYGDTCVSFYRKSQ